MPAPQPVAPPLPAPPANSTVLHTGSFSTAPQNEGHASFSVPGAGTLTVSVTWDSTATTIGAALTEARCQDVNAALAGTCFNLAPADLGSVRPKAFTATVAGALSASVWVRNMGTVSTSGEVRVVFTPSPVATPPPPTPTPRPTATPAIYTCNGATAPAFVNCPNNQGTKPPTARCNDDSYSCSTNRSGTCSSHGGVACYICPGPLC